VLQLQDVLQKEEKHIAQLLLRNVTLEDTRLLKYQKEAVHLKNTEKIAREEYVANGSNTVKERNVQISKRNVALQDLLNVHSKNLLANGKEDLLQLNKKDVVKSQENVLEKHAKNQLLIVNGVDFKLQITGYINAHGLNMEKFQEEENVVDILQNVTDSKDVKDTIMDANGKDQFTHQNYSENVLQRKSLALNSEKLVVSIKDLV